MTSTSDNCSAKLSLTSSTSTSPAPRPLLTHAWPRSSSDSAAAAYRRGCAGPGAGPLPRAGGSFHQALTRGSTDRPGLPRSTRRHDLIQALVYVATDSIALLADLIHNAGDALTALPLGVAFLLRSERAERWAGLAVVFTIFISAVTAGAFAVERLINPLPPAHLLALALAGVVGVIGNAIAARVRLNGGRRLDSAALIADGQHAQSDAIVSVGVVLTAAVVALGAPIADPIIGLLITGLILRITWESWRTVRHADHQH